MFICLVVGWLANEVMSEQECNPWLLQINVITDIMTNVWRKRSNINQMLSELFVSNWNCRGNIMFCLTLLCITQNTNFCLHTDRRSSIDIYKTNNKKWKRKIVAGLWMCAHKWPSLTLALIIRNIQSALIDKCHNWDVKQTIHHNTHRGWMQLK